MDKFSGMTRTASWSTGRIQKETKLVKLIVAVSKAMVGKHIFPFLAQF